jgi:hypothetical protein
MNCYLKDTVFLTKTEKNQQKKEVTTMSYQTKTNWRNFYSGRELKIIDLYHAVCVRRGWWPVNADSKELHDMIYLFEDKADSHFKRMFKEAADERDAGVDYTSPLGNKLLRILVGNR